MIVYLCVCVCCQPNRKAIAGEGVPEQWSISSIISIKRRNAAGLSVVVVVVDRKLRGENVRGFCYRYPFKYRLV